MDYEEDDLLFQSNGIGSLTSSLQSLSLDAHGLLKGKGFAGMELPFEEKDFSMHDGSSDVQKMLKPGESLGGGNMFETVFSGSGNLNRSKSADEVASGNVDTDHIHKRTPFLGGVSSTPDMQAIFADPFDRNNIEDDEENDGFFDKILEDDAASLVSTFSFAEEVQQTKKEFQKFSLSAYGFFDKQPLEEKKGLRGGMRTRAKNRTNREKQKSFYLDPYSSVDTKEKRKVVRSKRKPVKKKRIDRSDRAEFIMERGSDLEQCNEERKKILERWLKKRKERIWRKKIRYPVRKKFADSRMRVKGRFISKKDNRIILDGLLNLS
eukprot:snap_masked-scaffold_24-processed-gene-2.39-mRNA-1 protein AED:0.41 eAED:0.41 QI:0/-1/0/1/-1/1/1/0/321